MEKLRNSISGWNGKSIQTVERAYNENNHSKKFVSEIIHLIGEKDTQIGASWLLKKHLEQGNELAPPNVSEVFSILPNLDSWESKLHILQCVPLMELPIDSKEYIEDFLRECLGNKNKFIRAWAYGGFYELANWFPEYREEASRFIDSALISEPASVRARIRNAVKTGFLADDF